DADLTAIGRTDGSAAPYCPPAHPGGAGAGDGRRFPMTILVSSTVPGLLGALEQAMGVSQELPVVRDAERLVGIIRSPDAQFTALILNDTIEPRPHQEVAQSLWEIVAYMSRHRRPQAPVLLTLARETPAVIQDALQAEVRKTGG